MLAGGALEKLDTKKTTETPEAGTGGRGFRHDVFLLRTLVGKDFKLKYRRSVLGVLWSVLNPLLMMVVLTAVFSFMFRFDIENYPLYLILGTILFGLMSGATTSAMLSIVEAAPLLKKIRVERAIFPMEKVIFELVNFTISLVAAALVMLYFQVIPTPALLLLPFLLLCILMFSLGIGLLLSSLAVFFRDVIHLWGVVITAWTYATPLFYPMSMLDPWMQDIMNWNPMYHYVSYFRDIVMYGTIPSATEHAIIFGCGAAILIIGFVVFRKLEKKFILFI